MQTLYLTGRAKVEFYESKQTGRPYQRMIRESRRGKSDEVSCALLLPFDLSRLTVIT